MDYRSRIIAIWRKPKSPMKIKYTCDYKKKEKIS